MENIYKAHKREGVILISKNIDTEDNKIVILTDEDWKKGFLNSLERNFTKETQYIEAIIYPEHDKTKIKRIKEYLTAENPEYLPEKEFYEIFEEDLKDAYEELVNNDKYYCEIKDMEKMNEKWNIKFDFSNIVEKLDFIDFENFTKYYMYDYLDEFTTIKINKDGEIKEHLIRKTTKKCYNENYLETVFEGEIV